MATLSGGPRVILWAVIVSGLLSGCWVVGTSAWAAPTGPGVLAAQAATVDVRSAPAYYMAIGASESVGVQPAPGHPYGVRTDHGYANDLVAAERHRWPGLRLVQFGCPGTTLAAAVRGGGACPYPTGSQLATAVAFIRAHGPSTVLATVDLGFNDLRPCLAHRRVDQSCLHTTLPNIGWNLHLLLGQLSAAGGRHLHVVGLEHNDPFLGFYFGGRRNRTYARATVTAFDRLNATLRTAYRRAGDPVADVPRLFDVGSRRMVRLTGRGRVPAEVALACRLGWTCSHLRYAHHNVHPNARGYDAIADAAAAALGKRDRGA
ncbi:MAG TPA: SGNH/GDSL hydrolase family protein [Acidimicrobiales bacterium]|nr:SGNH/GDSL hydrolase family protein [Acidimicrobiales bacterium]